MYAKQNRLVKLLFEVFLSLGLAACGGSGGSADSGLAQPKNVIAVFWKYRSNY